MQAQFAAPPDKAMIEQHNTIIIIPARMAAKGLPGKPLADIHGQPLIVHTWKRAVEANIGHVLIAAAENSIAETVRAAGGDAMVTPPNLAASIDRVAAAIALRDQARRFEYVINLPANLPNVDALTLRRCLAGLTNQVVDIATVATQVADAANADNSHITKVVVPLEGEREVAYARDFTRQNMPSPFWQNIPIFAFRRSALEKLAALPASANEKQRGLEMMRALDNDMKIAVVKVDSLPLAVDTPAHLETARRLLRT